MARRTAASDLFTVAGATFQLVRSEPGQQFWRDAVHGFCQWVEAQCAVKRILIEFSGPGVFAAVLSNLFHYTWDKFLKTWARWPSLDADLALGQSGLVGRLNLTGSARVSLLGALLYVSTVKNEVVPVDSTSASRVTLPDPSVAEPIGHTNAFRKTPTSCTSLESCRDW
jgi:hypothetical protein